MHIERINSALVSPLTAKFIQIDVKVIGDVQKAGSDVTIRPHLGLRVYVGGHEGTMDAAPITMINYHSKASNGRLESPLAAKFIARNARKCSGNGK